MIMEKKDKDNEIREERKKRKWHSPVEESVDSRARYESASRPHLFVDKGKVCAAQSMALPTASPPVIRRVIPPAVIRPWEARYAPSSVRLF